MVQKLIVYAIGQILRSFGREDFKELVDTFLDKAEDKIKAKPDAYDAVLLMAIDKVRDLLGIDDKKYGIDKEAQA